MFVPPWFSPGTPAEALVCTPRACVLVHDVKSTGSYRPSEPGKSTNNFVRQRYSIVGATDGGAQPSFLTRWIPRLPRAFLGQIEIL